MGAVSEHLGFQPGGHTTRKLRDPLERLRVAGFLAHSERQMREQWGLTSADQEELARLQAAGRVGGLPESPQHREWRLARVEARRRSNEFRGYLNRATEEADEMAAAARVFPSRRWFEVGNRLRTAHWLVGAVTHCLEEWDEPDDACPHNDPEPNLAPGRRAKALGRGDRRTRRLSAGGRGRDEAGRGDGPHEGPHHPVRVAQPRELSHASTVSRSKRPASVEELTRCGLKQLIKKVPTNT